MCYLASLNITKYKKTDLPRALQPTLSWTEYLFKSIFFLNPMTNETQQVKTTLVLLSFKAAYTYQQKNDTNVPITKRSLLTTKNEQIQRLHIIQEDNPN